MSGALSKEDLTAPNDKVGEQAPVARPGLLPIILPTFLIASLLIAVLYPGAMSTDSRVQLAQGKAWIFTDFYPPLMAAIWGILDRFLEGPQGMFFIQVGVFLAGVGILILSARKRCGFAAYTLLLIALMPHVTSMLGTIWKDVVMGGFLLLSGALLSLAAQSNKRFPIVLSVLPLWIAASVRLNALPAVLPFCVWSAYLFWQTRSRRDSGKPHFRILLLAGIYLAVLVAAGGGVTRSLTKGEKGYNVQMVFLFDLAALSIAADSPQFPLYVHQGPKYSFDRVKEIGTLGGVSPLVFDDAAVNVDLAQGRYAVSLSDYLDRWGGVLKMTKSSEQIYDLMGTWLKGISSDPITYLRHRWTIFARLIAWGHSDPFYPFHYEIHGGNPSWMQKLSAIHKTYLDRVVHEAPCKAWFWLLASGVSVLVAFCWRGLPLRNEILVFGVSAILYGLCFFVVAPAPDARYVWWCNVAGSFASLLALVGVLGCIFQRSQARN